MTPSAMLNRSPAASHQRGVALVVVLILLVVMTLLGLVSLRGTLMQERMSASQFDRSLSFQGAEAALREGESKTGSRPMPTSGCAAGICAPPLPTDTPRWLDDTNWATVSAALTQVNVGTLTATPRYIVEYMGRRHGSGCTTSGDVSETVCADLENVYRITARSQAAGRADVILQTMYTVP